MKKQKKPITVNKKFIVKLNESVIVHNIKKDDPNRQIKLFGKEFKGITQQELKKDVFTKEQRELFDDLVYAKKRMTKNEIESLPLIKKYRVKVLSNEIEKTLSQWKSEIVNSTIDSLLLKLFPKSKLVKDIVQVKPSVTDYISADSIDIHKMFSELEIAQHLASKNLFPKLD